MVGHVRDLRVCQAGVRLADIDQAVARFVVDGEGVIGEHVLSLAVPDFDAGDDHVQRRERFLQLEPAEPAAARCVAALRVLHHQALVVSQPGAIKDPVQLGSIEGADQVGEHEGGGEVERLEQPAPFAQRLGQQVPSVEVQQVEGDEDDRHLGEQLRADDLTPEPVLQLEKRKHDTVFEGEELAVQQDVVGHCGGRGDDFGKGGGHLVQIARVEHDPVTLFVQLAADPIVFVLHPGLATDSPHDGRRVLLG